jgi:hypothetical protein
MKEPNIFNKRKEHCNINTICFKHKYNRLYGLLAEILEQKASLQVVALHQKVTMMTERVKGK